MFCHTPSLKIKTNQLTLLCNQLQIFATNQHRDATKEVIERTNCVFITK